MAAEIPMSDIVDIINVQQASAGNITFYEQQIAAAVKIIESYDTESNMTLLLAQMQSGKSGCFILASLLMLHLKKVDEVVLFSGVRDVALYEQLVEDVGKRSNDYEKMLDIEKDFIRNKMRVVRSTDLKRIIVSDRTLIVWDEAHYAQNTTNLPAKFFISNGFRCDGTTSGNKTWTDRSCYLLTVSATPFSEFVNCQKAKERIVKKVVRMVPGERYKGVKYYLDHNKIHDSFNPVKNMARFATVLRSMLSLRTHGYMLVRVSGPEKVIPELRRIIKDISYDIVQLDMDHDDFKWSDFETRPQRHTIVFLKGMGRLGQVVPKQYIRIVFESTGMSTDTVLQSLLGRMCGYSFGGHVPHIYVCDKFTKKANVEDIEEKYNDLLETKTSVARAMGDFKRETEIEENHVRGIDYACMSELERYVNFMDPDFVGADMPRYAKNIKSSGINVDKTIYGYHTIPAAVCVGGGDNFSALEHIGDHMAMRGGCVTVRSHNDLACAMEELYQYMLDNKHMFGSEIQTCEMTGKIRRIIDSRDWGKITFGNMGQKSHLKEASEMRTCIENRRPYTAGAFKRKDFLKEGKNIYIGVFQPTNGDTTLPHYNAAKVIYVSGLTLHADEDTIRKREFADLSTTRKEIFCEDCIMDDYEDVVPAAAGGGGQRATGGGKRATGGGKRATGGGARATGGGKRATGGGKRATGGNRETPEMFISNGVSKEQVRKQLGAVYKKGTIMWFIIGKDWDNLIIRKLQNMRHNHIRDIEVLDRKVGRPKTSHITRCRGKVSCFKIHFVNDASLDIVLN